LNLTFNEEIWIGGLVLNLKTLRNTFQVYFVLLIRAFFHFSNPFQQSSNIFTALPFEGQAQSEADTLKKVISKNEFPLLL